TAIEYADAVPSRRMSDKSQFIRISIEDFDADVLSTSAKDAQLLAAGDIPDRRSSTERPNVALDNLVQSRQAGGKLFRFGSRGCLLSRLGFASNHRNPFRLERASVAGVTGHFAISSETVLVDAQHHSHHVPRDLFRLFVILVKMLRHMAVAALHAERGRDESHGGDQLIGPNTLEHLNVLEHRLGGLSGGGRPVVRRLARRGILFHSSAKPAGDFSSLR